MNRWWATDPSEIYWLETTDRTDLGVDLTAPQADDRGNVHPAYALLPEVHSGEVVFHYHTRDRRIAYWSRIVSSVFQEDIVWASHGTVAREAGVEPYRRPGWRALLEGPFPVEPPITLARLREAEPTLRAAFGAVRSEHKGSLYLPFALSEKRPLRPTQYYLTKMPLAVVLALPALTTAADLAGNTPSRVIADPPTKLASPSEYFVLGSEYVIADEEATASQREPFTIDPNLVDRGLRGHAATQNALAEFARHLQASPRSPGPREPQYDLAWTLNGVTFVAEVKSLTKENEERQLRLGLGQVLRYAHILGSGATSCIPVLAVERRPVDESWESLCTSLGVRLCWPGHFDKVLRLPKDS